MSPPPKETPGIVYVLTCTTSGDQYVGATRFSAERRWSNHQSAARTGVRAPLYDAIRKYGPEAFTVETVDHAATRPELFELERLWISNLRPRYNLTMGGDGLVGYTHSEKTKAKISASNAGENHWNWGRTTSEEVRAKQKANSWMRGRVLTPEECEARRQRAMGNTGRTGQKLSEEHRRKISEAHLARHKDGTKFTDEHRRNISEAMKARHRAGANKT